MIAPPAYERIFGRETAVKRFSSLVVEYGDVNPDASPLPVKCDGSLLQLPRCTANGFCATPQAQSHLTIRKKLASRCHSCCWRLRAFND
jgi:hypothetical protein